MNIFQADLWKVTLPGGQVIDSKNLEVTKTSNESARIKPLEFSFDCTLDYKDHKLLSEICQDLINEKIKSSNDNRNQFIEFALYQYMFLKDISRDDMKRDGLHLAGPGWDEYRYKDDMIIRIEDEFNWDEGFVSYRYSVNKVLK